MSTRTIYNQFGDRATLFEAVIADSAQRIADAQIITAQRHLGKIVNIEDDLIEFGRAWAEPAPEQAPHFALLRQIIADANHIPGAALRAWQDAGPLRVRKEIAAHLRRIADTGHLTIADADLAAIHLVQLASRETPTPAPTTARSHSHPRRPGASPMPAPARSSTDTGTVGRRV